MNKLLRIRITWLLLLILLLVFFLFLKVVPCGQISYSRDYSQWLKSGKGFVYGFTPAERVDLKSGQLPRLIGDPIYFSVFTPRTFDEAKLIIKYRDRLSSETPVVEAGVLVDKLVWRYDLKPVQNKILDELKFSWPRLADENTKLILQRDKNYSSVLDFERDLQAGQLKDCPGGVLSCVAVYNYPLELTFRLPDYQKSSPLVISTPLRGAHQFYIYLKDEPLKLDFEFVDLNQDKELDPIIVTIYRGSEVIASQLLVDNNVNLGNGQTEEKKLSLLEPKLPSGVYKVEVRVNDDIVIKKITSSIDKLVFINKLWPVSTPGRLTFYTDQNYLQVKALNPAALQTIKFGEQSFKISETYKQFTFKTEAATPVKKIQLPGDEIILENGGVFAFSPESLFNPGLKKIDRYFVPSEETKYLIANYQIPRGDSELRTAEANFNLIGVYREKGKYNFMISIPGLQGTGGYLEIQEIKLEFKGRTLWQKIFN